MMDGQSYKVNYNEVYLTSKVLANIVQKAEVPQLIIEEEDSELWFETLNGSGKITFQKNIVYEGNVRYGILDSGDDGKSVIIFPDGTKYEGEIRKNRITGKGLYTFPTGNTYNGDVLNGLRHGYGVYQSTDGIKYEGEWRNGLKHGKGTMVMGSMKYEGDWKDGVMEGLGKIKWQSGNYYEGEFKNNKMHGNGFMIWYDANEKYTGQWCENLQQGFGIHIIYEPKGEQKFLRNRYVGEWNKGVRHGYGIFFYSNGSKYEGICEGNYKDGFGVFTFHDGSNFIGKFKNDRMIDSSLSGMPAFGTSSRVPDSKPLGGAGRNRGFNANTRPISGSGDNRMNTTASGMHGFDRRQGGATGQLEVIAENANTNANANANTNAITVARPRNEDSTKNQNQTSQRATSYLFKTLIDISDLIDIDPDIENSLKEIELILLRNLSDMRYWYAHAIGKELSKDTDMIPSVNESNLGIEMIKIGIPNKAENEEKQVSSLSLDGIYKNDLSFCMEMKDLWKLLREVGLVSVDFTLAQFDRLFFRGAKNYLEMFMLPEDIDPQNIYQYIYLMIGKSKNDFSAKYKKYLDFFGRPKVESGVLCTVEANEICKTTTESNNAINKKSQDLEIHQDFHNKHQVVLLRQFYEAIVRIAYLKFSNITQPLHVKLKNIIQMYLKSAFKPPRNKKGGVNNTHLENSYYVDIKVKNTDTAMETYIANFESILRPLFKKLYFKSTSVPKKYDMALTYRFFYKTIILRSRIFREIYSEKHKFAEVITYYHKEKLIIAPESTTKTSKEIFDYLENLFDCEFIFLEFCEMVYLISRKHFHEQIIPDSKNNFMEVITHIGELLKDNDSSLQKGKCNFEFPILPQHVALELMIEAKNAKLREEERKLNEEKRMEREQKLMSEEDFNMYIPETSKEDDDSRGVSSESND